MELDVVGFDTRSSMKVATAAWKLLRTIRSVKKVMRKRGIDVVVGFGGYVSVAPVLAARSLGCRIIIHEQNVIMGRANRYCAPHASVIARGLPSRSGEITAKNEILTGIPLRESLRPSVCREEALGFLGLDGGRFTLLVIGGSQGAHALNGLMMQGAPLYASLNDFQVIHLSGAADYGAVSSAYARAGVKAAVFPFLNEMEWAYAGADLALCRAGALTVVELAEAGVPAVMIPYPESVGGHQDENARLCEERGGAFVMSEDAVTAEAVFSFVGGLKGDRNHRQKMGEAMRSLAVRDAAELLVDLVSGERNAVPGASSPAGAKHDDCGGGT
jgi:UDP-N-acetylglucosamine--N-acetylmuramyl-(pentapeptide) pyrophosphoryl-undecaprenol N-acetylglucosamine transferase